jgi:hypothetical protein
VLLVFDTPVEPQEVVAQEALTYVSAAYYLLSFYQQQSCSFSFESTSTSKFVLPPFYEPYLFVLFVVRIFG